MLSSGLVGHIRLFKHQNAVFRILRQIQFPQCVRGNFQELMRFVAYSLENSGKIVKSVHLQAGRGA
jgi:hypothetical protein